MSITSLAPAARSGWRRALLALSLLLACAGPQHRAAADDDPYTATVTVDATSDSVAKARDAARTDGARLALAAIADRLAGGAGKAKPVKLSDSQITDLVASFEVANEKMSAVRYVADYTFHFRQAETAKALQAAGVTIGDGGAPTVGTAAAGKPVVVLPVYQDGATAVLWDDPNPWREAWSQRPAGTGPTALMVPLGDASDVAAIDADKARSGDSGALAAVAKKEGAGDVLVMLATLRAGGDKPSLDVTVRRYRAGQFIDVHMDSIAANPSEQPDDLTRRAADVIAADLDSGWKNAKDALASQQGSLVVTAQIAGLDDWVKLRDRLSALPSVRKIEVKSLSRQEAMLEIDYVGTLDQLKASLAAGKLDLQGGDPTWHLARSP